jgi:colicin import membrane protein
VAAAASSAARDKLPEAVFASAGKETVQSDSQSSAAVSARPAHSPSPLDKKKAAAVREKAKVAAAQKASLEEQKAAAAEKKKAASAAVREGAKREAAEHAKKAAAAEKQKADAAAIREEQNQMDAAQERACSAPPAKANNGSSPRSGSPVRSASPLAPRTTSPSRKQEWAAKSVAEKRKIEQQLLKDMGSNSSQAQAVAAAERNKAVADAKAEIVANEAAARTAAKSSSRS